MTTTDRERAVVLGAGIAGLLAARVLADHYAEVLVVDRDPLDPTRPTPAGLDQHPERPAAGTAAAVAPHRPGTCTGCSPAGSRPSRSCSPG